MFTPDNEELYTPPEIEAEIKALKGTLWSLCKRYLNGCNSVYDVRFYRTLPPDPSDIEEKLPLFEGVRRFVSEVLGGPMTGFAILDNSKAELIHSIGAVPQTKEDLARVLAAPILEVFKPLQASIYSLEYDAINMYDELFKPSVMSIASYAVCVSGCWFIMMAEWSD